MEGKSGGWTLKTTMRGVASSSINRGRQKIVVMRRWLPAHVVLYFTSIALFLYADIYFYSFPLGPTHPDIPRRSESTTPNVTYSGRNFLVWRSTSVFGRRDKYPQVHLPTRGNKTYGSCSHNARGAIKSVVIKEAVARHDEHC